MSADEDLNSAGGNGLLRLSTKINGPLKGAKVPTVVPSHTKKAATKVRSLRATTRVSS